MKKLILLLCAVINVDLCHAQIYGGVSAGYAAPFSSFSSEYYSSTPTQQGVMNYSLGKGFHPQIFIGYPVSHGIHLELGAQYNVGFNSSLNIGDSSSNDIGEFSADGLSLIPSVVIDPCDHFGNFSIYSRFGLNVGIGMREKQTFEYTQGNYTENKTIVNRYNPILGFIGGMGLNYEWNKSSTIFIELDATSMSATPKKGEYTVFDVNGIDQLPSLSNDFKSWTYVEERTKLNPPANEHFGRRSSFSSVSATIGFRFQW